VAIQKQRFDPTTLTVLIVDDHDPIRKAIKRVVSHMGFVNIIECFDGADALRVLKSSAVDLIILDLYMKRMTGIDVLQHISDRSVASDIPVVVVTGEASKEDIVKVAGLGASDYLLKPFQANELEKKILSVLNSYHAPVASLESLHRAEKFLSTGRYIEALQSYDQTLDLEPMNPRAVVGRSLVLAKLNKATEALSKLRDLVQKNPNYHKAYRALGDILLESGQRQEALSAMQQELAINPKQPERQIQLARLMLQNNLPEEAVAHFRAALRVSPKNTAALMGLGHAFAALGNLDKSVYYFHRVRRYLPNAIKPLEAAVKHCIEAGDPKKAEYLLKDERKISVNKHEVSTLLASFYLQQKRNDEALAVVREILQKSPDHAQALRICGNIHLYNGDLNEALPILEKVVKLLPTADAFNNLAELQILMRQIPASLETLNESIRLEPNKPKTFVLLAQVHVMTQQWVKAAQLYMRAVQLGASEAKFGPEIVECSRRRHERQPKLTA
jgi:two-component system chemotaxis response regulator CheY